MSLRDPDIDLGTFREENTIVITTTLKDSANVAIPGSELDTAVWSLWDEKTKGYINSRKTVDMKSNINESGLLTLTLTREDMAMVGTQVEEKHRLTLEWTWNSTYYGSYEAQLTVSNLLKVPTPED